jgi:crotonobetainyl-CoA:carnitine CoA-transferase CaiB-like acyl-CoA transferase
MSFPLAGVTVLDLTDESLVLAPRLLADLGAGVIRIESSRGDGVRNRPPFLQDLPGVERSFAHILYNAGKRSLAVDLEHSEARQLVSTLLPAADILIAPMEPGPLGGEFFDEARIRALAPNLGVVDAVFSRNGPSVAVTDLIGTAAGGLLYLNGYPEDPPNLPAGKLAYKQVALAAALGAMSLLLARRDSAGGRITVSMQEAVMTTTIQTANENYWHWHRARPGRRGLANVGGQTVFPAKDGRWVSFYQHPPAWGAFVEWVVDSLDDGRFCSDDWADGLFRFQNQQPITDATAALCLTLPREHLVREAQRRGILVVPVQGAADIAGDSHLRARNFFQTVPYKQLGADLEVTRPPFVSSAYQSVARRAPALGEHTREVLTSLAAYTEAEVDGFVRAGVVVVAEVFA